MRGAGVITSIVTRIFNGSALNATLYFKSWDEINSEMELAMVLFPALNGHFENAPFDIRRKPDRSVLQKALDELTIDQWFTDEVKNSNSVLLVSYLRGYETVKDIIGPDTVTLQYAGDHFGEHRSFVGNDTLAVYLRDVELEINTGDIDSRIEIADCQGSDSSNPLHLAAIQDYLLRTHLIVYVISSRTGLRQADIKFLTMIKKMGIMENILFVVNADFSEHATGDDLIRLVDRVREDLSLIKPDPWIYTISALYNLFTERKENLPQRDRQRLAQWKRVKNLVAVSDRDTENFSSAFHQRVTSGRSSLLLKNNLERLNVIVSGLEDWVRINHEILSRDAESANAIIKKIKLHQMRVGGIKAMIKSTLDGSVQKVKHDLKTDIDRFFDVRYGEILADVIEVIRGFKITHTNYRESLESAGFSNTLFLVFQEFRRTLDRFMADTINPAVIRFVRSAETGVLEYFESIAKPYDTMAGDAIAEYADSMGRFGITLNPGPHNSVKLPDIETIKAIADLSLPPAAAVMHYSARIRTEASLRLGFYSVAKMFKRLLRKPVQNQKEQEVFALKDGVLRMKRETERSVVSHFKDYKENIKFQYLFKIVDAISNSLYKLLNDRFKSCDTDLTKLVELIGDRQDDKQRVSATLKGMVNTTREIHGQIERLREKIDG